MRTRYFLILVVAVTIASGCSTRRRGEAPVTSSVSTNYWAEDRQSSEFEAADTSSSIPESSVALSEPGFLDRLNPFRQRTSAGFSSEVLTCQNCQQKHDVLMDGKCIDCLKSGIDRKVLSRFDSGTKRENVKPRNRFISEIQRGDSLRSIPHAPEMGLTSRRKLVPIHPELQNSVAVDNTNLAANVSDNPIEEMEIVPGEIVDSGGDFSPAGTTSPSTSDLSESAAAQKEQSSLLPKMPEPNSIAVKGQEFRRLVEEFDSSNEKPKPSIKKQPAEKSKLIESESGSEKLAIATSKKESQPNPKFETFSLDDLFSVKQNDEEERDTRNTTSSDDGIEWGVPVVIKPKTKAGKKQNKPSDDHWELDTRSGEGDRNDYDDSDYDYNDDLNDYSQRTEEDIIRDLQNSTVPNRVVFDNTPALPQQQLQQNIVVLSAKPVPHYQELRQIARQSEQPSSFSLPPLPIRDLPDIRPAKVQAMPVSSRNTIENSEFDFRPLPELSDSESLELIPSDENHEIQNVYEPLPGSFPTVPDAIPAKNTAPSQLISIPNDSRNGTNGIILRAVPKDAINRIGNGESSTENRSKAAFKFAQPR